MDRLFRIGYFKIKGYNEKNEDMNHIFTMMRAKDLVFQEIINQISGDINNLRIATNLNLKKTKSL